MKKQITTSGFLLVYALSAVASILVLSGFDLLSLYMVTAGYLLALLIGAFHPGDKTRLQFIFLSLGTLLATWAVADAWSWKGWIAVGVCAFMVLTMKLDGGDDA